MQSRVVEVVSSWRYLYDRFLETASSGPELYFHMRCLKLCRNMENGSIARDHAECLYAVLTAWGMNSRNARLAPFNEFYASLRKNKPCITKLRRVTLLDATEENWDQLKEVWDRITVTKQSSKYQLVGRSKLLAHLFPNWIAPIDRVHTIAFLKPAGACSQKSETQWRVFKQMHQEFFAPTARQIRKHLARRRQRGGVYNWNTSIPKAIDNLIWGTLQTTKPKKKRT